jgi:sulfopyruvate decarboxylase TPP-binding subunit
MSLDTNQFVNRLVEEGFNYMCVVPCSFAKHLINAAINNEKMVYIPCASEAVLVSVAAGLKMSGEKPIIIVQSSGITNMGSNITSLLKPYDVTVAMIVSWRSYKEGDSEIQHKHLSTNLPSLISAYGYEYVILDKHDIEKTINQIKVSDQSHTVCLLENNTFLKVELEDEFKLDFLANKPRSEFLSVLNEKYKKSNILFIGTTGNTAREMYKFMNDTKNFYMAGNMGRALSLGVGAAFSGRRVIVCGGDAEFVMHMGGLTTAGRYREKLNLTYILFDNESNKSTGGQGTYQDHMNYIDIVKNSNFIVHEKVIKTVPEFKSLIDLFDQIDGLRFIHVKCGFDEEVPRPPLNILKESKFK